jgi:hypothetical protein
MSKRGIPIPTSVKRDFIFYYRYARQNEDDIYLLNTEECIYNRGGDNPLVAFYKIDTHGGKPPFETTKPNILESVLRGKRLINFQIKQYVEGVLDGTSFMFEIEDICKEYPDWVIKAIRNQVVDKRVDYPEWLFNTVRHRVLSRKK